MFSKRSVFRGAFSYIDRKTPKHEKKDVKKAFNYILKALNSGHHEKTVRRVMEKHGWSQDKVDLMFKHINKDNRAN